MPSTASAITPIAGPNAAAATLGVFASTWPAPATVATGLAASLTAVLGLAGLHRAWLLRRAWQRGVQAAQAMQPLEHHPARPVARVLLLGDSTGVGVGAEQPRHTLAGLLARACPRVEVVNRSRNGARVADALAALPGLAAAIQADGRRFDLALLLLGGNDALHGTSRRQLSADAAALLAGLQPLAARTAWLGCADIGASPVLPPPLSWLARWRTGRTVALLRGLARARGVAYLDFFDPPAADGHARRAGTCFADDGLHPSAAGYRHCFASLLGQGLLPPPWRGPQPGWAPSPFPTGAPPWPMSLK